MTSRASGAAESAKIEDPPELVELIELCKDDGATPQKLAECPRLLALVEDAPSAATEHQVARLKAAMHDVATRARKFALSDDAHPASAAVAHSVEVAAAGIVLGFLDDDARKDIETRCSRYAWERLNATINTPGSFTSFAIRKIHASAWHDNKVGRTHTEKRIKKWLSAFLVDLRLELAADVVRADDDTPVEVLAANEDEHEGAPTTPTAEQKDPQIGGSSNDGWPRLIAKVMRQEFDDATSSRPELRFYAWLAELGLYALAYVGLVAFVWAVTATSPEPPDGPLKAVVRIIKPGLFPMLAAAAALSPFVLGPAAWFGRKYRIWSLVVFAAVAVLYSLALLYSAAEHA